MKHRSRFSIGVALFLCVVSIAGPLFARLCFMCPLQIGECEADCKPVPTKTVHAICDICRHLPQKNECPEGYYCCTACAWRIHDCKKGPNYSIQCSNPPYISIREEEEDLSSKRPLKCVQNPDGVTFDCKDK